MVCICKFLRVVFKHGAFSKKNIYIYQGESHSGSHWLHYPFSESEGKPHWCKEPEHLLFYFSTD